MLFKLEQVITERTLTSNRFETGNNPHVDPIKPISPMAAPLFAKNLIMTAALSRTWKISRQIPGLLLLSGEEDTYVESLNTEAIVKKSAPHFHIKNYPQALHELDNEAPSIAEDVWRQTVEFFDQHLRKSTTK